MTNHSYQRDAAITGAGPVGLFAVFGVGMPGMEVFARMLYSRKRRSSS